jgi:large subunit ribosomal protein L29
MANAHNIELRGLGDAELASRLVEAKDNLFKLRFQMATGQQDNNAAINQARREVARLNTLIREREIALHEAMEATA